MDVTRCGSVPVFTPPAGLCLAGDAIDQTCHGVVPRLLALAPLRAGSSVACSFPTRPPCRGPANSYYHPWFYYPEHCDAHCLCSPIPWKQPWPKSIRWRCLPSLTVPRRRAAILAAGNVAGAFKETDPLVGDTFIQPPSPESLTARGTAITGAPTPHHSIPSAHLSTIAVSPDQRAC